MILAAGAAFTAATPFPGTAALLPVAGAALVILAAAEGRASPTRLLRRPPDPAPRRHVVLDLPLALAAHRAVALRRWGDHADRLPWPSSARPSGWRRSARSMSRTRSGSRPSFQPLVPTFRFALVGMLVLSMLGSAQLVEAQLRLNAAVASTADSGDDLADEWLDDPGPGRRRVRRRVRRRWATSPEPASMATGSPAHRPTIEPGSTSAASAGPHPPPTARIHSCRGAAAIVRGFSACPQDPATRMVPDPLIAGRTGPTPTATAAGSTRRSRRARRVGTGTARSGSRSSATPTPGNGSRPSRSSPSGTAGASPRSSPLAATRPTPPSSSTGGPPAASTMGDGSSARLAARPSTS